MLHICSFMQCTCMSDQVRCLNYSRLLWKRCNAYIFSVVKNVPIDVSAHAQ